MKIYSLSGITSEVPARIAKKICKSSGVGVVKEAGGQLVKGRYKPIRVSGPSEFARLLPRMGPHMALVFGLAGQKAREIFSKAAAPDENALTRTLRDFHWSTGPGIWLLDHDRDPRNGAVQIDRDGFLAGLIAAVQEMAEAPMAIAHSTSSFVYDSDTGICLLGEGGHHAYVFVADASDIKRAGKVLADRLWLQGYGYCIVSKSGQILYRSLVDAAVWLPNHLCFAGAVALGDGLVRRQPEANIYNDRQPPLDTRKILRNLTDVEIAKVSELKAKARAGVDEEAVRVRAKYAEDNVKSILEAQGKTPTSHPQEAAKIREAYISASQHRDLYGPFELEAEDGTLVIVDDILANLDKYHGWRFCDPLERDYCGDRRIAYLNTRNARGPYLHSHAHGGRRFYLRRERVGHRLVAGERVVAVKTALEALRMAGTLYERNGEIVRVTGDGEVVPVGMNGLLLELDRHVRWLKPNKKAESGWVPADCPRQIAEGLMAARGEWGLPKLRAVATTPTMNPLTGRIIDADGYDPESGLLLVFREVDSWPGVPTYVTEEMVRDALVRLWRPFLAFPFIGSVDRGVFLAALLSAVIRALLPTCPGFAFVASTAGSGKTLLARCVSILAGSVFASVMTGVQDEDEMRKRLLAAGRRGSQAMVLDNINSAIGSDALCAWLTSEFLTERILGQSEDAVVRTGGMVIMTGNNLRLKGDLCRRVLVSRIEPGVETPWKRSFDLDPGAYCRTHQLEMVTAALVVLRHYMHRPNVLSDRTASFETWSDSVRRAVAGVADDGLMDVEDPIISVERSYEEDPSTLKAIALFSAWETLFNDRPVRAQEVASIAVSGVSFSDTVDQSIEPCNGDAVADLKSAVFDIAGEGRTVNTRRLAAWLAGHADRIITGRRLTKGPTHRGNGTWVLRAA